jgi:hypothetical protein
VEPDVALSPVPGVQVYDDPPLALKTTELPLQIVLLLEERELVTEIVGVGETVTVVCAVFEQPAVVKPVTV